MASDQLRRIFIFDNPRTCSQLFSKLFANHPDLQLLYHPFLPAALYGPERYQQKTKHCAAADEVQREWGTSEEFREWNVVTYESANRKLVEEIEAAERQIQQIHLLQRTPERVDETRPDAHPRPTSPKVADLFFCCLGTHRRKPNPHSGLPASNPNAHPPDPPPGPDHPAILADRVPDQKLANRRRGFYLLTTYRWSRDLFSYLRSQSTSSGWRELIVIDAYDVVHRTGTLTGTLCGELGLDPAGAQERWRQLPREEWPDHSVVVAYTKDLLGSSGVERDKGKPLEEKFDIEAETEKWKGEFGGEVGMKLRKCVEAEMADYEYLRSFKMEV
ncbi:hypothetical protein KC336_g15255 [Hortaea werneckii]|nr:hypothetical protein KC336_g15255 [Hortaea werneckii]